MASYTVTINIDPYWVTQFNNGNYTLVVAKAMGSPNSSAPTFNVVAQTYGASGNIMPTMVVQWTDTYQLSATQQVFNAGTKIQGSSLPYAAPFGDTYYLKSWGNASVQPDSTAPRNGWNFCNSIPASSVVSLNVGGTYTPVYISPTELPPGTQQLVPIPQVCFWFSNSTSSGTMVTIDTSNTGLVDLSSGTQKTINFTRQGAWVNVQSTAIDYIETRIEQKRH